MWQKKLKEKDINLLDVYAKKSEPSKYEGVIKYALPPIVLVVLFGSVFGYYKYQELRFESDLAAVKAEITRINEEQNADGKQEKYATLQTLKSTLQAMQAAYTNMNSYPQISKEIINGLFTAAGSTVDIQSVNYTQESADIAISVDTDYLSQTDAIIRRLKDTQLFSDVTYTGYTSSDITEETASTNHTIDTSGLSEEELRLAILQGLLGNTTQTQTENKVIGKKYHINITCTLKKEVE